MTVHCSLHEKSWYSQLLLQNYAYLILLQNVYTKPCQNYLIALRLFFHVPVQVSQIRQQAIRVHHVCGIPSFMVDRGNRNIEVENIFKLLNVFNLTHHQMQVKNVVSVWDFWRFFDNGPEISLNFFQIFLVKFVIENLRVSEEIKQRNWEREFHDAFELINVLNLFRSEWDFLFFDSMRLAFVQRVNFENFLESTESQRRFDFWTWRLIEIGLKLNKIRLLHNFVKCGS